MPLTQDALIDHLRATTPLNGTTNADTPLFSSGALDSVAMIGLITFVEEQAGVTIRADDVTLANFDTAARIVRFAQSLAA